MLLFVLLLPLTEAYLYRPRYVPLDNCTIDRRSLLNSREEQLNDKLLCNYDRMLPPKPKNDSETLEIDFQFVLLKLVMAEQDFISLSVLTHIGWRDERLQWDPEYYDKIDETYINKRRLWLPAVKLYNSLGVYYETVINRLTACRIMYKGRVACSSRSLFWVRCTGDVQNWPFDTRVCSLEFGPIPQQKNMFRLSLGSSLAMIMEPKGADWNIVKYEQEDHESLNQQLVMKFTLERESEAIAAMVICPIVLLCILNLSCSFLDARRSVRLTVVWFSAVCNLYAARQWDEDVPQHAARAPTLLLCYRAAVVLNFASLLMVYVLKFICHNKKEMPILISNINEYVYMRYGKFVFPRWQSGGDSAAWCDLASLLNCVYIIVLFFSYLIMFSVYIPLRTRFEDDESNIIIIDSIE